MYSIIQLHSITIYIYVLVLHTVCTSYHRPIALPKTVRNISQWPWHWRCYEARKPPFGAYPGIASSYQIYQHFTRKHVLICKNKKTTVEEF